MLERRSALQEALVLGGRDGASGGRANTIGEIRGWSLLQVAGFRATIADLEATIARHLTAPPVQIGTALEIGSRVLMRTGPEQFWVLGPEGDDLVTPLARDISGDIGALTSLSHSRARLFIEGKSARDVLAKGIPLDLDTDEFPVGRFALTGLHHTPILLWRSGASRYEIWAMRSFALALWEWLADAAWPSGYEIGR